MKEPAAAESAGAVAATDEKVEDEGLRVFCGAVVVAPPPV